jgi:hypothetical protein
MLKHKLFMTVKSLIGLIRPYLVALIFISIMLILSYVPLFLSKDIIDSLTREDRLFEWLGAACFFASGILFILAFFRSYKYYRDKHTWLKLASYIALAGIFFIFAGEEISWGQRVFNLDSNQIEDINVQKEINIHNLNVFQGDDARIPISLDQIFVLFIFSLGLIVPLMAATNEYVKWFFDSFMPVFAWQLGLLMILNYVLQKGLNRFLLAYPDFYHHPTKAPAVPIYEIREHDYALILLVLVFHYVFVTLSLPKVITEDVPLD